LVSKQIVLKFVNEGSFFCLDLSAIQGYNILNCYCWCYAETW